MNSLFSFSDLYCLHVAHEIFSYAGSFDKRPLRQPENKIRNYNKLIFNLFSFLYASCSLLLSAKAYSEVALLMMRPG